MKIVYFIDHLRGDGTQRVLVQLVEGLHTRGHRQAVVCLNESWDESIRGGLTATGAEVRILRKAALVSGVGLVSTWRWLKREKVDVAVTFLFAADVIGRTLAHLAGVPRIVSSLRARNVQYASWQRWLVRYTMRWVDAVVLNSNSYRDFATEIEGAPRDRIYIIPNGVRISRERTIPRAVLRSQMGLPPDAPLIGSAGRLTFQKGFDILIQAFATIENHLVHLLIFGTGEEEGRLRAQAHRLVVQDRVHFLGYREDLPCLLSALDLYVHSARWEGMPNAVLEAMAAGCPIVATMVDGTRDLIEDGTHGWLVPVEEASAVARAIESALDDHDEAHRRAEAARVHTSNFTMELMVNSWECILAGGRDKTGIGAVQ